MNREVIPGAWYGDHLPTGEFVATIPGNSNRRGLMATHIGYVSLPQYEDWGLVTPRCTNVGGFRFAGQSHDVVGATFEYDGTWHRLGPTNGVNGCIYDRLGGLRRAGSETSQGYRYVRVGPTPAGTLITGDATYGPLHGLNEYTDLSAAQDGSLLIGQGNPDLGVPEGVMLWDGETGLVRELERGTRKFINAHVLGNTVSLAFYSQEDDGVVLRLAYLYELRQFPPAGRVPGPIVNVDNPPSKKEGPMPIAPNPLATIRAVFDAHPEINAGSDGERGELVNHVVRALGGYPWGRKEKTKGTGVLSDDALCYRTQDNRFEIYDIMIGRNPGDPRVPNIQLATFDYKGTFADGENGYFFTVLPQPGSGPVQPPPVVAPPQPPRSGKTSAQLREEIAGLDAFYIGPNGLNRGEDHSPFRDKGIIDWIALLAAGDSLESVLATIKTFDEYKRQHGG